MLRASTAQESPAKVAEDDGCAVYSSYFGPPRPISEGTLTELAPARVVPRGARAALSIAMGRGACMTGRRPLTILAALGLLAAIGGCAHRKGFIIGADLKLEFNRVPWRTGPCGQYEVEGPVPPGPHPPGANLGVLGGSPAAGGCPPAPLPGDCGLPPAQPHPRSRFHPLPLHDVLRGPAPLPPAYPPADQGEVIREEALPELVPPPGARARENKPLEKTPPPPETQGNSTRAEAPFELEEPETDEESPAEDQAPRAANTWTSNRSHPLRPPLGRRTRPRAIPLAGDQGD
jgi:hypothetical protein